MLRRIILALIGLFAVVNGSKWLFDGKRLPTLDIGLDLTLSHKVICHYLVTGICCCDLKISIYDLTL